MKPNYLVTNIIAFLYHFSIFQTDFRFYWLQTKLQEEPLVAQVSGDNPVRELEFIGPLIQGK